MKRIALSIVVLAALAAHCSASDVAASEDELAVGDTFDHVAIARMWIEGAQNDRVLPYEENRAGKTYAEWVGGDLASLHPTYVSGLIRYNGTLVGGTSLSPDAVADFEKVRSLLPADTKLDVVLSPVVGGENASADCAPGATNAPCNLTPEQVTHLMADIEDKIHPDVWFFDFFDKGRADTAEAAIHFAHSKTYEGGKKTKKKQLVGGNLLGGVNDNPGVANANFFALADDGCGDLDFDHLKAVQSHFGKPVLVHTNNNAQNDSSQKCPNQPTFACLFNKTWSQSQRKGYVDLRAGQAGKHDFTFMFPAFFPACGKGDDMKDPLKVYYDSDHDGLLGHLAKKI